MPAACLRSATLFGVDDSLLSAPLRNSLGALHDLFAQAPVLGSLIDPRAVEADLYQHDYESVRVLLGALLEREHGSDEQNERAVAAQGMARAAELLAGRYHLVVTNVPYLARGKQSDALKQFAQDRHSAARGDLATLFVSAHLRLARQGRRPGGGDTAELAVPDQLQEAPGEAAETTDVEPGRAAGAGRVRYCHGRSSQGLPLHRESRQTLRRAYGECRDAAPGPGDAWFGRCRLSHLSGKGCEVTGDWNRKRQANSTVGKPRCAHCNRRNGIYVSLKRVCRRPSGVADKR